MRADLRDFAFSFFAYRPRVDPVVWAESNLSLSSLVTETPGPYSTRLYPYAREPLNAFADGSVSDLVLCWGAQTAKTTTIAAGTLERIANSPAPTLIVCPTTDNAQSFSESRLIPLFESAECLRRLKPKDRDKFKKTEFLLSTCNVNLVGSNSPANLASRPVGLLVCDEVDKFPESTNREAGAIALATERTKAFASAKRVYTSTPTTETGAIWELFQRGDQRYFHVPCPHCKELIRLEWANVEWDQTARDEKTERWDYRKVQSSAFYKCQKCGGKITDGDKTRILRAGVWIPSNPEAMPGWRSYHLNSLYSASLTFGKLAVKWLDAKHGSISDLQNFINSTLAEPWKEKAITIKEEQLTPLLGSTDRGSYDPGDGGFNILTVDVQRTYLVYSVRRFFKGMKSHLIDWGQVPFWNDVDDIFRKYSCYVCGIDSGYGERTQEVYEQIAQRSNNWLALKGQAKMGEFFRQVTVDPFTGSKAAGQFRIALVHINDPVWTEELLARLAGKIDGWKLTKEIDLIYSKQILSTYKTEKKKRNGGVETSIRSRGDNHIFDCEKYALALAAMLGLGRGQGDKPADNKPSIPAETGKIEF